MTKTFYTIILFLFVYSTTIFSNDKVTLPSDISLPDSIQIPNSKDQDWQKIKDQLEDNKSEVFQDLASKLDQLIQDNPDILNKIQDGIDGLNNALGGLNQNIDQQISDWIQQEKESAQSDIKDLIQEKVDQWLEKAKEQINQATEDLPAAFTGPNIYQAQELPSFENYEIHSEISASDSYGNRYSFQHEEKKESIDIESSQERRTFKKTSLSFESAGGIKVMVYKQEKGFYLRHLLTADTKFKGSFKVNAQAAANMIEDANGLLGQSQSYASITQDDVNAGVIGNGEVSGNIRTQAEIDINVISREK